jgi:hypothetical protein
VGERGRALTLLGPVVVVDGARGHALLAQAGDVPHADRLVERGGDDEVVLGVELRAHDVVVVPCEHGDARARLPVPDADRLVVRGAANKKKRAREREREGTTVSLPPGAPCCSYLRIHGFSWWKKVVRM